MTLKILGTVRASEQWAAGGELRKVAEMAHVLDLSEQNVFKIVHLLSRAGLVAAERGRHGGVRLARPAAEIRVGDVVIAMESMPQSTGEDGTEADATRAGHGALFDDAFEAFLAVLNQSTVADMARSQQTTARRAKSKPAAAAVAKSADTRAEITRRSASPGAAKTRGAPRSTP